MGPPEGLILALRQQLGLTHFVETGTFLGHTAAWAGAHFPHVVTIELAPAIREAARARFAGQPHIRVLGGDSGNVLQEVLAGLDQPAVFWLDAHWSGSNTAGVDAECPVLAEISLLNRLAQPHAVLVDDARLFCAPPPRPHQAAHWPDLVTLVAALADGGRRHVAMHEDVFIAVPAAERPFLTAWLQDRTTEVAALSDGLAARLWRELTA